MKLSVKAQNIYDDITQVNSKLGDLRNHALKIKKEHALAMELWETKNFRGRLMAILIMDKKELDNHKVAELLSDSAQHPADESLQLTDWLMANQLMKDKKTIAMIETWENDPSSLKRRIFWYYQGRLRWTGQIPPNNTERLLSAIEDKMAAELPEVQWAMNFTAAWIGIFDKTQRAKCIAIGEKIGLFKDEMVARNCTPNYLPEFIATEVGKRGL